jgi:TPP-dependent pyruvate/acetoin dehydrogenase alpha subunit
MTALWLLDLFRTATLTRLYEERLLKLSMEGALPPLLHPGAGQEVSQLAVLAALRDDDPLLYAHRGLAYVIARGISLSAILADMMGRAGGTNNGKGGVMHIVDVAKGVYGQSGTLGGGLVVSVGMGMALKHKGSTQVVAHFFGDGASNRGTFHESLNWAAVQKLPCIYICENNGWAVSVPVSESTAIENIADRAAGYGIPGITVDGRDPEAVHEAALAAAARARAGEGPSLIELKAPRLLGHYATDPQDYRDDAGSMAVQDPLAMLRARLIAQGALGEAEAESFEDSCRSDIEVAVALARAAPELDPAAAFEDLYA